MVMDAVKPFCTVATLTNKGQFERYAVRNLQRVASVYEITHFLLKNYSEIGKYRVCSVMYENNHSRNYANAAIK